MAIKLIEEKRENGTRYLLYWNKSVEQIG